ncbi:MAG: hypothetical protein WKF37_25215 [Bryobacteraceae bacterium]
MPEYIFLLSLGFVLYVLFGYPLLLRILPAHKPGERVPALSLRTVSVILPLRNGEPWLARKLESTFSLEYPQQLLQVIVIWMDRQTEQKKLREAFLV